MTYTVRPLSDRTWLRPPGQREATRFDSSWIATLALLRREVARLDGRDLVIGVDVAEKDLRLDGTLRARARADTPAVEVAFDSKHGPMLYRCDRYFARYHDQGADWQQNVRAIAKTLEALRAVDRYGASSSGEQYRGYRQIEATVNAACSPWERLRQIAGHPRARDGSPLESVALIHRARRAAHPDTGGSADLWVEVEDLVEQIANRR